MDFVYKDLTALQKCAVIGFAIDFVDFKALSMRKLDEISSLLKNIADDLGVSRSEVNDFVDKMKLNGGLTYAINFLKTIENNKFLRLFYPCFYSVVATLGSHEGLKKLNKIYNIEFGYDDDEIQMLFNLFEIKKF